MAALGFALLEFFQMLSRRRFSSGDSARCSALGREPLLRSLLKLKPRERGRELGEVAECSIVRLRWLIDDAPMNLGPPLSSPRLVLIESASRRGGGQSGGRSGFSVERTLEIERALRC